MGYFPFYMDISKGSGLIIGGGTIALEKVEKLMQFTPDLRLVAPSIKPEIRSYQEIQFINRAFQESDLVN